MEAGALTARSRAPIGAVAAAAAFGRRHPGLVLLGVLVAVAIALLVGEGPRALAQATINGIVAGSYFALGAVGLTLVYGILRLVNFAHGDFLTFGAYAAFLLGATVGLPFPVAVLGAVAATALLGVTSERAMWRPMRRRGAGMLQLLIMSIGLAFVIRYAIQFIAGSGTRELDVDVTSSVTFLGLRIGQTELIVTGVAILALVAVAVMLRFTSLGKQMRALADNFDLAEVTGIRTSWVVIATWVLAGGLAGLAGTLYAAAIGNFTPNLGFFLLLSLFAAVILGGIGRAYGALVGGLVLGLAQEWSTLVIASRWKEAVSFGVLILVLIVRPQGIFGGERER